MTKVWVFIVTVVILFDVLSSVHAEAIADPDIDHHARRVVTLHLVNGTEVKGNLVSIGSDSVRIEVEGRTSPPRVRRYGCEDVSWIGCHDSLWNGSLIGFAAGSAAVGLFYIGFARGAFTEDGLAEGIMLGLVSSAIFGGLPGAGIGALLDWLQPSRMDCPCGGVMK